MQRAMMPGVAFGQIHGDLNGHRTAAILQPPRQGRACQHRGEAERVAGHNVDARQQPLPLLASAKLSKA